MRLTARSPVYPGYCANWAALSSPGGAWMGAQCVRPPAWSCTTTTLPLSQGERGRGGHTHSQLQDGQARKDMLEACRESRHTGNMVEKLAESLAAQVLSQFYVWLLQSGNLLFQFFLVGEAKLLKDSNLGTRKITKIKRFNLELKYIYTFSK